MLSNFGSSVAAFCLHVDFCQNWIWGFFETEILFRIYGSICTKRGKCKNETCRFSISHQSTITIGNLVFVWVCMCVWQLYILSAFTLSGVFTIATPSGTDLLFIIHTSSTFTCFFPSLSLSHCVCLCVSFISSNFTLKIATRQHWCIMREKPRGTQDIFTQYALCVMPPACLDVLCKSVSLWSVNTMQYIPVFLTFLRFKKGLKNAGIDTH